MKKFIFIPCVLVVLLFSACQGGKPTGSGMATDDTVTRKDKEDVPWITGAFYMDIPQGHFEEEWTKMGDNEWQATAGLRDSAGNITYEEKKRMVYDGEVFWYYTVVRDLGEMKFVEKSRTANEIVFENRTNDYPQQVLYRKLGDTAMLAYIVGLNKGNRETYQWELKRKK